MGAGDHHRRVERGVALALVVVDRDHAIEKSARTDGGDITQRAARHFFFRHQPAAAKTLRVADQRIDTGLPDQRQHFFGFGEFVGDGFFDQQRNLVGVFQRRQRGVCVQMAHGGDQRGGNFGAFQQLAVISGDKIRADFFGNESTAHGVDLGDADPIDLRKARCDFPAHEADATGADDGQANTLGVFVFHPSGLVF